MIKTIILNFLFLVPSIVLAQVGINTTTPAHKLDVNGDVLIEKHLIETKNRDIAGPFLLYTRSKDTNPVGEVKKLDPTLMNVAPVNRYKVIISNVNQDRVTNVDTGLSASKYFLAIADAKFVGANIGSNPITHPIAGARSEYGTYTNGVSVNAAGNYTLSLDFCRRRNTICRKRKLGVYFVSVSHFFTYRFQNGNHHDHRKFWRTSSWFRYRFI